MLQNQDVGLIKVFQEVKTSMIKLYYQQEEDMVKQLDAIHVQIQDLEEKQQKNEGKDDDDDVQICQANQHLLLG